MNYKNTEITDYELREFQNLINMLFQCCQERMQFQSEKFDLPDAEIRFLMMLKDEKYLTLKNIASRMNVGKSRMTKLVSGLEGKNLIKRIKDPEDSRIFLISLTAEGKEKLSRIENFQNELHSVILSQVSPEERIKLLTNLGLLKTCMESGKKVMV